MLLLIACKIQSIDDDYYVCLQSREYQKISGSSAKSYERQKKAICVNFKMVSFSYILTVFIASLE